MAAIEERRAALGEKTGGSDENLYNSRHTGEQIDGAVTSVLDNGTVWSGKAEKGEAVSLVLRKDGWDETRMTQTLTGSIFAASGAYRYLVGCAARGVKADDITTAGQITFRCETLPEGDLSVEIIRLEVKHGQ